MKDGSVKTDAGWDPISTGGQVVLGGWFKKPTKKMGREWDPLFKRSRPSKPKAPKKKTKTGGGRESASSYNGNRDFWDDAYALGLNFGGGSSGAIYEIIQRDLN